ncbi:hypothetical protein ABET11_13005 [Priestia megaterium]|jgi:hypothetical protein|uniref:Uncharacterized protein n=1 Tax=Priestia aryabhattai TaxID=412384 RepID=A0A7W3RDV7_PRIAR|nr:MULTISPECIES: hypothetical protein [Priestia]AVX08337.1 hypothetical protein CS527_11710 [Bacillus sp. Y-01]KOP74492.1 hypothetical protein AMS61_09190 [Bacillus sp. FJAT-21351]MBZ5481071.1 hypothetical protein [Bacillus sp. T_4]MDP9575152.1 hypothetical protein [Bacillus sp. 1751]KAA8752784.1 hypothetical protein FE314_05965 [Priestia megaterium]
MRIQLDFKVLNVIVENGIKSYIVQCLGENFRRVIKAQYDGSVYIPDYHQQFWDIPALNRTFIDIELANFIMKIEKSEKIQ